MKSIQTFLEEFNYIPFEENPKILLEAWYKFFTIRHAQSEDSNELFQKLLEDLKGLAEYANSSSRDRSNILNDNEDHLENPSNEIAASNSNEEKEESPQNSDIRQLIREECCIEVCEEQKQKMENTMLELVEIYRQKELLCMHDNVDDLIESALNTKLLSINSQLTPILSTKEPEYSNSMGYENPNTTQKTESDEIIKSSVDELVPILSENEIFFDSKKDDDISSDDDDFEDVEYVEASLSDPEIVSVEEENVVYQEEEEIDLEDISQIQDVVLREKLLIITHLIANIESLNDNPTPDCVLNSSVSNPIFEESDNSLLDNFSPEFKTFFDHTEETRSGNTTTHANDSLPEYDSFCFEIEPDQERLINVAKNDISDESTRDPLLEEADLFLAFDNSIPPVVMYDNDELECLNPRDEFDDYFSFMFAKVFPFPLSAETEDTIFDPGFTPHRLKYLVFGYLSRSKRSSHPFFEISLGKSISLISIA
uniref:Reverse transcriptase domain-containing protein n=1 Tax=Tanacetum cinerariifolium TaxID=118510 RepID=A0A699HEG4_TANCI|nr:hypothetical protein [Tanacetum cinerariifolium]